MIAKQVDNRRKCGRLTTQRSISRGEWLRKVAKYAKGMHGTRRCGGTEALSIRIRGYVARRVFAVALRRTCKGLKNCLLTYVHVMISLVLELTSLVLGPKGEIDRSLSGTGLDTFSRFTLHLNALIFQFANTYVRILPRFQRRFDALARFYRRFCVHVLISIT